MEKCPLLGKCGYDTAVCRVSLPDSGCYWYRWFKDLIGKEDWRDCPDVKPVIDKLRNIGACLRTVDFMLERYSLPDGDGNVVPFESTQDMARYFRVMLGVCLRYIDGY